MRRGPLLWLALAVTFAAQCVLFAVLAGNVPWPALALTGCAGAFAVALATGWRDLGRLSLGRDDLAVAGAGVLGWFVPIAVVAGVRYTDAPSGAEMVFLAGTLWAVAATATAAVTAIRGGRSRVAAGWLAGMLAAVVAGAGVLGNWERPSSFSPFMRNTAGSVAIVLAGVAFVYGAVALRRLSQRTSPGRVRVVAGASALLVAAIALFAVGQADALSGEVQARGVALLALASAYGLTTWLLPALARESGLAAAGAALFAAPVLVSGISLIEPLVAAAGPQPVLFEAVGGASALAAAGIACVLTSSDDTNRSGAVARVSTLVASLAAVSAIVGLARPALDAEVVASTTGPVTHLQWSLPAAATVSGWVAVALAGLALYLARSRGRLAPALAIASSFAYLALANTPLQVLTGWMPAEVQSDFGTEYARIVFLARPEWLGRAAVLGSCVALAVVLAANLASRPGPGASEDVVEKEQVA